MSREEEGMLGHEKEMEQYNKNARTWGLVGWGIVGSYMLLTLMCYLLR